MSIINNKLVLVIGITLILIQLSFAQKNPAYFMFDTISKETFLKEDGRGNKVKELLYRTNKINSRETAFYIKDVMFVHDNLKMKKNQVVKEKACNSMDLLLPNDVEKYIRDIQKKYPFGFNYLSKEYPKMFIANVNEDKSITLYQVKWQYYVE